MLQTLAEIRIPINKPYRMVIKAIKNSELFNIIYFIIKLKIFAQTNYIKSVLFY